MAERLGMSLLTKIKNIVLASLTDTALKRMDGAHA